MFLNGEVRYGAGGRCAVPVFLARRGPDHVTRSYLFDLAAPALDPTAARRHDQRLAQRVAVPCRPSARLERDTGSDRACGVGGVEQRVNPYSAREIFLRSFVG